MSTGIKLDRATKQFKRNTTSSYDDLHHGRNSALYIPQEQSTRPRGRSSQGKDDFVAISGGLTEVLDDSITVLADAAERRDEIDVDRARVAEETANQEMEELLPGTPEHDDCLASLKRAQNRAAVAAIS